MKSQRTENQEYREVTDAALVVRKTLLGRSILPKGNIITTVSLLNYCPLDNNSYCFLYQAETSENWRVDGLVVVAYMNNGWQPVVYGTGAAPAESPLPQMPIDLRGASNAGITDTFPPFHTTEHKYFIAHGFVHNPLISQVIVTFENGNRAFAPVIGGTFIAAVMQTSSRIMSCQGVDDNGAVLFTWTDDELRKWFQSL